MLLALADRSLSCDRIRADLDSTVGEYDQRRRHATATKHENTRWETLSKKLSASRLQCKNAAATKANKEDTLREKHNHEMELAFLNVNLRAYFARQALRHEYLGMDKQGRKYLCLAIRPIEENGRPPTGWASGLLVYGKGIVDTEDLPASSPRWSHFGKSESVKQLAKWVQSSPLAAKLEEVVEWLAVLEWKGYGERV